MRTPPRPVRGARGAPTPISAGSAAPAASRLKILVAGLDKDARGPVEASVRQALGARAADEPWTVSLVRLGGRWSVTLNGPSDRTRSISLTAEDGELARAIRRAIDADSTLPVQSRFAAAVEPAAPHTVREDHVCEQCHRPLVVSYESRPGEPKELAPAACPHCWQINQIEIGAWAAEGREYRCEKA